MANIRSISGATDPLNQLHLDPFLSYRPLYTFLLERSPDSAAEVQESYVNTIRLYMSDHLERLIRDLSKAEVCTAILSLHDLRLMVDSTCQASLMTKSDMIGGDNSKSSV